MEQLKKYITFLSWFPLRSDYLRADIVAGITVALVLIPQSMAYAQLAGLPPYFGLYAAFLPVMIAAMFGSSKQLATGPVAVVSLLTASALIPLVAGYDTMSPAEIAGAYAPLAILMAFLVGGVQLFLGVFKLGVIVNFLSHPVIVGFTNAAAMIIGLSQLNKIFGVSKTRSESFVNDIMGVLQQIPEHTHMPTLAFGIAAILILWSFKKYLPKIPGVLVAVASLTTISYLVGFEQMGGSVVGTIPEGLPALSLPNFNLELMGQLLPTAIVISLVGFMEAISIAKAMAAKTKDKIDPNQELIGQGIGNIVGSIGQSYPTSGSFSRSAVNIGAGAKTGMSSVITGLVVLITLLFLTPMLYHLPSAVLAAVIMMAVIGLINFGAVKHAWKACKHDVIASMVTFVATLGFAPHLEEGIMVGAGLAIGLYLYRSMKPRVAHLGRYDDGTLRDLATHPDLPTDERIIVVRFD
ncbi:MAG: sulfate permease, partial [Gammaproteobacteria bacterium]|nr:sulfate permease [Gammaproteobacteria bacterium]